MKSSGAVDFEDVRKVYSSRIPFRKPITALAGVTLSIAPGEVFGLFGPNRAGKTTLVKILLSICRPTSGWIKRLGRPIELRQTLARVGYVHENPAFPRYLSAQALLDYYGGLSFLDKKTVRDRSKSLLERVGLADRAHEPIARFSKGMLQRLGLAQALLSDPELLVLDEPAEGMDLLARRLIHEIIVEQRNRGRTVLLVSHQVGDVEALCDRLAVLNSGRLAFLGTVAELTKDSATGQTVRVDDALERIYRATVT